MSAQLILDLFSYILNVVHSVAITSVITAFLSYKPRYDTRQTIRSTQCSAWCKMQPHKDKFYKACSPTLVKCNDPFILWTVYEAFVSSLCSFFIQLTVLGADDNGHLKVTVLLAVVEMSHCGTRFTKCHKNSFPSCSEITHSSWTIIKLHSYIICVHNLTDKHKPFNTKHWDAVDSNCTQTVLECFELSYLSGMWSRCLGLVSAIYISCPRRYFRPNCESDTNKMSQISGHYLSQLHEYITHWRKFAVDDVMVLTCRPILTSGSRLVTYKRCVLVSCRNLNVLSRSLALTSRAHPWYLYLTI